MLSKDCAPGLVVDAWLSGMNDHQYPNISFFSVNYTNNTIKYYMGSLV